ncbi:MAG: hypothetical protein QOJ83_303 [Frankiales bacterium]|jgi:hypothetical protein|nr:hypothetical protein [Frankiales bacterium]
MIMYGKLDTIRHPAGAAVGLGAAAAPLWHSVREGAT